MEKLFGYSKRRMTLLNFNNVDLIDLDDNRIYFFRYFFEGRKVIETWEYETSEEALKDFYNLSSAYTAFMSSNKK